MSELDAAVDAAEREVHDPNIAMLGRCLRGEMSSDEIEAFDVRPERLLDARDKRIANHASTTPGAQSRLHDELSHEPCARAAQREADGADVAPLRSTPPGAR
jgi:hypothetical protein